MSRSRLALVGSAVAATVAVGAVFFSLTGGSKVHAATILRSLRERTVEGVRISFQEVKAEGFALSGEVRVEFIGSVTIEQLTENPPAIGVVYASASVDHDGHAIRLEGAVQQASSWIYLHGELPEAGMFAPGFRHGVLVDLGADALRTFEGGLDGEDDQPGMPVVMLAPGAPAQMEIELDQDPDNPGGMGAIPDGLLKSLFSGKAGPEQMKEIETALNQSATSASIQDLGSGQYLLVCTPTGDRLDGVGTTRLSYTQQRGVEWIEVTLVGEATGTIRIDFPESRIDAGLLDKARVIEQGKTTIIDPKTLQGLLPGH